MKKPIIQIVRVEHPLNGKGLHRSGYIYDHSKYDEIKERHNGSDYPTPFEDDSLLEQTRCFNSIDLGEYLFAFNSIEQLKVALTLEELKECVERCGFKVYLLSVDDYFQSSYQVIFKEPISKEDISNLFL